MENKIISLKAFRSPEYPNGIEQMIVGYGPTPVGVGGDAYIIVDEGNKLKAMHCTRFSTNGQEKHIEANWIHDYLLLAGALKPYPQFFNKGIAGGNGTPKDGMIVKYIDKDDSVSSGLMPNHEVMALGLPDGYELYKHDAYGAQGTTPGTKHKSIWQQILEVYLKVNFKVNGKELRFVSKTGTLIQPVTFDVTYQPMTADGLYRLTVNPIDFEGSVQFSVDGLDYDVEPELTYMDPEGKKLYVKDSAGTIEELVLSVANWPVAAPVIP